MKPTGHKRAYLRECFDVLSADPPGLRWRFRPRSHFYAGKAGDAAFKGWGKSYAGQIVRPTPDGRVRVFLDGRTISAQAIIAEIGVTPIGMRQGILDDMPDDRLADTREVAGTGPLAAVLRAAMAETPGRLMTDLMVMSAEKDPYRMDTAAKHRVGQWFAAQVARFVDPAKSIHPRGVFYACVSAGDVKKPDGDPFENNAANEVFIGEAASYARWLDYVPFERLIDNKNDKPIVRLAPASDDPSAHVWGDNLEIEERECECGLPIPQLDADALGVSAGLAFFVERQPYRLVFFGEKTSLEDVIGPLAEEFSADLYLMGGQISDTYLHQMAKDAAADGRPLVVFTFSDCDPAGYWDMPTVIGRKLQALRDLKFPSLEFTVVHAALSPEQASGLDLPSSPLKEGEGRAAVWEATYNIAQIEIDALATLQPDELERIAREAIAPYFDTDLAERVRAAYAAWRERASEEIAAQVDEERLDALRVRANAALEELRAVNGELAEIASEVTVSEPPALPEPDMDRLEEAQDERRDAVLIDSGMDYVEATDRLRAHSEKAARKPARCR